MDGDCSVCYCVKETELVSLKLFVRMSLKPHSEQRLVRMLYKLMPHSHQSLNMFKSCFVKHSLIFFFFIETI